MSINFQDITIVSWNIRDLGDDDKYTTFSIPFPRLIPLLFAFERPSLILFPRHLSSFQFIEFDGTRGGILIAWDPTTFSPCKYIARKHSLSLGLHSISCYFSFTFTNIYAPSDHAHKQDFLAELHSLSPII